MSTPLKMRILYVGRKSRLAKNLRTLLEQRSAHTAATGDPLHEIEFDMVTNQRHALQTIRTQPPTVLMVEIEQRSESRVRFCELVRYRLPTVAILAVAAEPPPGRFSFNGLVEVPLRSDQLDQVLTAVAEQYSDHVLQKGTLSLNVATRTVSTPKGEYPMTPKQCALLQMLLLHHDSTVKRSDIMRTIWDTSYLDDTRTLDVHIRWLRERIEPDPSSPIYLKTVRGIGYRLNLQHA